MSAQPGSDEPPTMAEILLDVMAQRDDAIAQSDEYAHRIAVDRATGLLVAAARIDPHLHAAAVLVEQEIHALRRSMEPTEGAGSVPSDAPDRASEVPPRRGEVDLTAQSAGGRCHDGCRYQGVVFAMRSRPGWAWACTKCGQGGEMPADWFPSNAEAQP